MSIEVDWQIVDEDVERPEPAESRPPAIKPRRRLSRKWLVVLALVLVLGVAGFATYYEWTYRQRLGQVTEPVQEVARLEAQAIAVNDRASFIALQDPSDAAWQGVQGERFSRPEHVGLPEFGWKAMGVEPKMGPVELEPSGVSLDVTYRFLVTQPTPGGPVSVTLQVPQYYKLTPSGWVHARLDADYWGPWRTLSGKRFAMAYTARDAQVLDGLIPRMDEMLRRVCGPLPCPPQPVFVIFDNSPEALLHLSDLPTFDGHSNFILRMVSPHWIGLPADTSSRDELYRAIGTRVIQTLVYEASERQLDTKYLAAQEIVHWQLASAGLTGPFITPQIKQAMVKAMQTGEWQPLETIPLRKSEAEIGQASQEAMIPFALAYLEDQLPADSVAHLIPAMATSSTLGDAIRAALGVSPLTLEPAWQQYLRIQAGVPLVPAPAPPQSELALWCAAQPTDATGSSIWRIQADGTGLTQITANDQNTWAPHWSPDGKQLAYAQGDRFQARVIVTDMDRAVTKTMAEGLSGAPLVGWLPDGRLQISEGNRARLLSLVGSPEVDIMGTDHTWSPDGKWVAYLAARYPTSRLRIADADGYDVRQLTGVRPVWSPDSKRLAFLAYFRPSISSQGRQLYPNSVTIADLASGDVKRLVRIDDLLQSIKSGNETGQLEDLAWSPDGKLLAIAGEVEGDFQQNPGEWSRGAALWVIDADTGTVRTRWVWAWAGIELAGKTWSSDGRHLAIWVSPDSAAQGVPNILDVQTGGDLEISGRAFDWSPDGQWLAVAQQPSGVLLVTSDLTEVRSLNTPSCFEIAWRPDIDEGH